MRRMRGMGIFDAAYLAGAAAAGGLPGGAAGDAVAGPGRPAGRRRLLGRMAGRVVEEPDCGGRMKEVTQGGVCGWGREGAAGVEAFRKEIRKAFGERAPRVLDPFASGEAIPLGAMRLGCEVAAADINPVAWFILRCTLHYPHAMAGACDRCRHSCCGIARSR